jgi:hypothetical protein
MILMPAGLARRAPLAKEPCAPQSSKVAAVGVMAATGAALPVRRQTITANALACRAQSDSTMEAGRSIDWEQLRSHGAQGFSTIFSAQLAGR